MVLDNMDFLDTEEYNREEAEYRAYLNDSEDFDYTPCWITKDGNTLRIKDMTTSHIRNCMRMIERSDFEWRGELYSFLKKELNNRDNSCSFRKIYKIYDSTGGITINRFL